MNFQRIITLNDSNRDFWRRTKALHSSYKEVKNLTSQRRFRRAAINVLGKLAKIRQEYYFDIADKTIAKFLNYSGMKWAKETTITRDNSREAPKTFQLVPKSLYNDRTEGKSDKVKIAMNPVNKLDLIHRGLLRPSGDGLHFTFPTLILKEEDIFTVNQRNYGYTDWDTLETGARLDDAAQAWRFLDEFITESKVESLTVGDCGLFMHTFSTFCTIANYLHIIEWGLTNEIVDRLAPEFKPILFKKLLVHDVVEKNIADELKLYIGPDMFSNVSVDFVKKNAEAINLVTARLVRPTIIWKVKELMKNRVNNKLDMASNV